MPRPQDIQNQVPQRSTDLLESYKRAILWRKLMLGSFSVIFAAIMFWIIPWFPYGLDVEDYNERISWLLALVAMASITAFGTIYHRDVSRRVEQTILTWSTVHDGLGDARKREYFYDRVVIQCERAGAAHSQFTVIALRLEGPDQDDVRGLQHSEQALRILLPTAEESDCLAILGPHEIGVLATRTNAGNAATFSERLRSLVAITAEATLDVRVGWAVFPDDSEEAGSLVGLARQRLQRQSEAVATPEAPAEDESTSYHAVA